MASLNRIPLSMALFNMNGCSFVHFVRVAFGYKEGEEQLSVLGNGDGAISQFEALFVDDQVVYVLFGFTTEEDSYGRLNKRVLITFVGPRVKPFVFSPSRFPINPI